MLYLNTIWTPFWHYNLSNLTLTNVVFEYKLEIFFWSWKRYLTLTNVVFESNIFNWARKRWAI